MEVYFDDSISRNRRSGQPGKEIKLNKDFVWEGQKGSAASLYVFPEGMVMDICLSIPRDDAEQYFKKWNFERRTSYLTNEEMDELERENPFLERFKVKCKVNGSSLKWKNMYAVGWHPFTDERGGIDQEAEFFMNHYGCDRDGVWKFIRCFYLWEAERQTEIHTLDLIFQSEPMPYTADHFITKVGDAGKKISFTHPVTHEKYRLEICGCEFGKLPENSGHMFPDREEMILPDNMQMLTYRVSPEIAGRDFYIQDTSQSDAPKKCGEEIINASAMSVSVIGGMEGPAMDSQAGRCKETSTVYSSLHFKKVEEIQWRIVFNVKGKKDLHLSIAL